MRKWGLSAALWLLAWGGAEAQDGGQAAVIPVGPRPLSTLDFFRHAQIGDAKVSPDGKYIALLIPRGKLSKLGVIELADRKPMAAYDVSGGEFIPGFEWVNDHLVVWQTAKRDGSLDKPYYTGHLMAGRADTPELIPLPSPSFYLGNGPEQSDSVLVQNGNRINRLDIDNKVKHEVALLPDSGVNFAILADHQGKVRMISGEDRDEAVTFVWDEDKSDWREIRRAKSSLGNIVPIGSSLDDRRYFIASSLEAPTQGIYETDPSFTARKLLFRDGTVDYSYVLFDPATAVPAGVLYYPGLPAYRFFDPDGSTAHSYAALQRAFPGCTVLITSNSRDGHLAIVAVGSDVRPWEYFLVDLRDMHTTPLFAARPWIDAAQMSSMTPFELKARDGLPLHGYLTLPRRGPSKSLPLVVLVHGGPVGERDRWGFDEEVQFLAYHGYAVLQVNYRGSGGYGREFELLGYGKWGAAMQDDVTDATHWAIEQGIADPRRICIYGASYGGYAALMGTIREPDLYRCAIGHAGPYDLALQRADSDTADTAEGRIYLKQALGADKADLKARSPVYNVDRIKASLFLVHGRDDQRVPYENFKELASALKKAGKPFESLVKDYEGHGFYEEDNNVELYDRMLAFLDHSIGPRAAPATLAK